LRVQIAKEAIRVIVPPSVDLPLQDSEVGGLSEEENTQTKEGRKVGNSIVISEPHASAAAAFGVASISITAADYSWDDLHVAEPAI
jgi:hypothetical protein